ncbi:hypothetical protein EV644_103109 [Kribbella orskensis]|uniref:Uncharacterized protein n=1 Tax=Kribbella orskensis TaxID=2512216 RepID=A0ABY2BP64_9ACTN|nr:MULTISPECIES: hypothetical protein [Kribbella]TCN39805.1 hypothetical protein EV642_106311 [Kribbella sp. VKM Ac-2500]TCO27412.1 hypothetical protein EV644_103109 [Kribbella orskensis]
MQVSKLHLPGEPDLTPLDRRALAALTRDLSAVDSIWSRLDVAMLTPPAAGSVASADLTDKLHAYAHDHAAMSLRASVDHLMAWRTLLRAGEIPIYAHLSLLRTAHEAALMAYWLAEPAIDARSRLGRGVAAQAADYDERRKLEDAIGLTVVAPPAKLAVDRLSDLMKAADGLGLVCLNKKGQQVLAVGLPATVELFDLYESVERGAKAQSLYRFYSGYAHAKQWALSRGAQPQAPLDHLGRTVARIEGSALVAVGATRRAVEALDRATTAYEMLRATI